MRDLTFKPEDFTGDPKCADYLPPVTADYMEKVMIFTTPPTPSDAAAHGSTAAEPPIPVKPSRVPETDSPVPYEKVDWQKHFYAPRPDLREYREDLDLAYQRQCLASQEVRCAAGSSLLIKHGGRFLALRFPWRFLIPLFFRAYRIEKPAVEPILREIRAERQAKTKEAA